MRHTCHHGPCDACSASDALRIPGNGRTSVLGQMTARKDDRVRLHMHTATGDDVDRAIRYAEVMTGAGIGIARRFDATSRTHARAIELVLTGNARGMSRVCPGMHAASWDQWGHVLAFLFDVDPDMRVTGAYDGEHEFHTRTRGAFGLDTDVADALTEGESA